MMRQNAFEKLVAGANALSYHETGSGINIVIANPKKSCSISLDIEVLGDLIEGLQAIKDRLTTKKGGFDALD